MTFLEKLIALEKLSSKILGKKHTKIQFIDMDSNIDHVASIFSEKENMIFINSKFEEIDYTVIAALLHESRHAYQYQVINGYIPANPSDDPTQWAYEFGNNIIPKDLNDDELNKSGEIPEKIELLTNTIVIYNMKEIKNYGE